MCAMFTRRRAVRAATSLVAAALSGACTGGQSAADKQQVRDLQATVAALQAQLSRTPPAATAIATPTATASLVITPAASAILTPRVGAPASLLTPTSPPKVGDTVPITLESGERLEVTVNSVIDPATSTHPYNKAKGRWVVLDWTISNRGSIGHRVNIYACLLQTADGFMLNLGNSAGLPQPELISGMLGPGQTVRGFVPYDVATGAKLKAVVYQPLGNRQFVVADLTQ